jgi:hypothetical protein
MGNPFSCLDRQDEIDDLKSRIKDLEKQLLMLRRILVSVIGSNIISQQISSSSDDSSDDSLIDDAIPC